MATNTRPMDLLIVVDGVARQRSCVKPHPSRGDGRSPDY
jgi:hypothetical protein